MLRVGLTGGLASGKSFAGREFERLGCSLLQADRLGHRVLAEDREAVGEVVRAFGIGVLGTDGSIRRKALAGIVFADESALERLNAIVHPRVFRRLERFFEEVAARDPAGVAMVEAAIMIETGSYKRYQRLVLAACPAEMQVRRCMRRDGLTLEEAEARLARQMPTDEKRPYADYVIDTSGAKDATIAQVQAVYRELRAEAERHGEARDGRQA